MFTERLNQLLAALGATSAQIAKAAGCDKSNISRMCSGARVPPKNGQAARRLAAGIYAYADEHGKLDVLRDLQISGAGAASAQETIARLTDWLYEGMEEKPGKQIPAYGARYRSFGEKLSALMDLAELSNARLGRLLNLDASGISRFRSGLRQPKRESRVADEVCEVLWERIRERNGADALSKLMKKELPADEDDAPLAIRDWLFDIEKPDDSPMIEDLLENIDSFSADAKNPLLPWEEAADAADAIAADAVCFGTEGLRGAVIRFLGAVIREGGEELLLYSDQPMDWMVGDAAFRLRWASLMTECVKRGVRIRIIHNLDRNLGEMTDAIKSWLPLYMSGMIESYYCKKQRDSRFSHTLFLCPGTACIEASNIAGQEAEGIYRYHTKAITLAHYGRAYDGLLAESKPLVRIVSGAESAAQGTDMTVLGTTLSLATMPEKTLCAILDRCGADESLRASAVLAWRSRKRVLERCLAEGYAHECVPIADDEDLFDGKTPVDIPGAAFFYTPQEYAEHVKNIIALSESNLNYRFCSLPDAPFPNTQIVLTENTAAVSRLKQPCVTFIITHPAICGTFESYANRLKEQYKADKMTVKKALERYL